MKSLDLLPCWNYDLYDKMTWQRNVEKYFNRENLEYAIPLISKISSINAEICMKNYFSSKYYNGEMNSRHRPWVSQLENEKQQWYVIIIISYNYFVQKKKKCNFCLLAQYTMSVINIGIMCCIRFFCIYV